LIATITPDVAHGQAFGAMDSALAHGFGFNEAISIMVLCSTQEEVDSYSAKLSVVPEAEQCGWLKDKFVSWQIVPEIMDEMLTDKNQARRDLVTQVFLRMKKFEIGKLLEAYGGDEPGE
jgi:predicted 3-demethylubiquinone-9 3-methyltransferase (glyoxalase superfamily)